MTLRSVVLSCALLLACGGSSSGTLKVRGADAEVIPLGDSDPGPAGGQLSPILLDGFLSINLSANGTTKLWGDRPKITLSMAGAGVGVLSGKFFIEPTTTQPKSHLHNFFIDEWRFTGNGGHPFHIAGHSANPDDHTATPDLEVTFAADTDCDNHFATPNPAMCGGAQRADVGQFTATITSAQASGCPPEIVHPFFGAGMGAQATYNLNSAFHVAEAELTLGCVPTLDSTDHAACGASQVVTSGGCSWKAFAWAAPYWDPASQKNMVLMWVGATTSDASCSANRACNTSLTAWEK